jgi:hypothetical protein
MAKGDDRTLKERLQDEREAQNEANDQAQDEWAEYAKTREGAERQAPANLPK